MEMRKSLYLDTKAQEITNEQQCDSTMSAEQFESIMPLFWKTNTHTQIEWHITLVLL